MIRLSLGSLLAFVVLVAPLAAQSTDAMFAVVEKFDGLKKAITIRVVKHRIVAEKIVVTVNVNGFLKNEERTIHVPVHFEEMRLLSLSDYSLFNGDGKPLAADVANERIEKGTPIVVGGKELLRVEYRRLLRPEAVVLIDQRAPKAVAAPMPVPPKQPEAK